MKKTPGWTIFPAAILRLIYRGELNKSEARLVSFITRNTLGWWIPNDGNKSHHQRAELEHDERLIAKKLNLDLRSVQAATQSLVADGLIHVRDLGDGCFVYSLTEAVKAGKGFTEIPNWFLDIWLAVLKPAELRIAVYVLRRTRHADYPNFFSTGMRKIAENVNMTAGHISTAVKSLIERELLNVERSFKRGAEGRFVYRFAAQKVEHLCNKKWNTPLAKSGTRLNESVLSERKRSQQTNKSAEPFVADERVSERCTNEPEPAGKPAAAIKGEAIPISIPQSKALTQTDEDLQTICNALAQHNCTLPPPDINLARTIHKLFHGYVEDIFEWLEDFDGSSAQSWRLYVHVAKLVGQSVATKREALKAHAQSCPGVGFKTVWYMGCSKPVVHTTTCEGGHKCPSYQRLTAEAVEAASQAFADKIGGITAAVINRQLYEEEQERQRVEREKRQPERKPVSSEEAAEQWFRAKAGD